MFDHLPCTSPCPPTPPTTLTTHPCDGSVPSYDTNAPTAVVFFFLHPLHLDGVAVAHFFHVVRMRRTTSPLPHAPTHPPIHALSTQHFSLCVATRTSPTLLPPPLFCPLLEHNRSLFLFSFFVSLRFSFHRIKL